MQEEHGWLIGRVADPFGHHWDIARPLGPWPPAGEYGGTWPEPDPAWFAAYPIARPGTTPTMRRASLIALAALLVTPAAAEARPSITSMSWSQRREGTPGPASELVVRGRVRVCARRGTLRIRVRQAKVSGGGTTFATGTLSFARRQRAGCQTHRVRYDVADPFIGVGQYRIAVAAIDRGGVASRTRNKRFPSVND